MTLLAQTKNELHSKTIECNNKNDEILNSKVIQNKHVDKINTLTTELQQHQDEAVALQSSVEQLNVDLKKHKQANSILTEKKQLYKEKANHLQTLLLEKGTNYGQLRQCQVEIAHLNYTISGYNLAVEHYSFCTRDLEVNLWQSQENERVLQEQFQAFRDGVGVTA
jgi:chromosome segregation ATPase